MSMWKIYNPKTRMYATNGDAEWPYDLAFLDQAEAIDKAAELAASTGEPWLVHNIDWQDREQERFTSGVYRHVAWRKRVFWRNSFIHRKHYAHVCVKNPELISFTADEHKGAMDIQTPMKPGAYLKKFFADYLDEEQIKELANLHKVYIEGGNTVGFTLSFADTSDDIVKAYGSKNVSSCMDGEHFENKNNPTCVYAAGDLAIAYIGALENVEARALVWPAKKIYGRVYPEPYDDNDTNGDHEMGQALLRLLDEAGYEKATRDKSFNGAKLKKIKHPEIKGAHIMPYLDHCYGIEDDGEYFRMERGDENGQETQGYIYLDRRDEEDEDAGWCERCEDNCNADEMTEVHLTAHHTQMWCESCTVDNSFYCRHEHVHVDVDNGAEVDGRLVAGWCDEINYCEHTNEHTMEDVHEVTTRCSLRFSVTERWCEAACNEDAFKCSVTGGWYAHELASEGTLLPPDDTRKHWMGVFKGVDAGQADYHCYDPAQEELAA